MDELSDAAPREELYCPCPDCAIAVSTIDSAAILQCPNCGRQFFKPSTERIDTSQLSQGNDRGPGDDDELSGLRIRQITVQRRSAFRARSYCIIGAAACAVMAVQFMFMMCNFLRADAWPLSRTLIATAIVLIAGLICAFVYLVRRTIALTRELREPMLEEPPEPPDFSSLSDGSQYAQNLENIGSDKQ